MKKYKSSITMSNTIDELYEEYKKRFNQKIKYLRSKGITPRDIDAKSKFKFKDTFYTYREEHKKTSANRALDKIITDEFKTSSKDQAMRIVKESHKTGSQFKRKYSLIEAMYGGTIWEEIKEFYWNERREGMSATDAKHYIAVTFFGSP